jgi:hypothetical protein
MTLTVHRLTFTVSGTGAGEVIRAFRRCHPLNEARQHLFHIAGRFFQNLSLVWKEKSQIAGQKKETDEFVRRSGRNVEKLPEFSVCSPSAPFCNIGGDRSSSPSHLTAQAELLRTRVCGGGPINTQGRVVALLPYLQVSEVLHCFRPFVRRFFAKTVVSIEDSSTLIYSLTRNAWDKNNPHHWLACRFLSAMNGQRRTANAGGSLC